MKKIIKKFLIFLVMVSTPFAISNKIEYKLDLVDLNYTKKVIAFTNVTFCSNYQKNNFDLELDLSYDFYRSHSNQKTSNKNISLNTKYIYKGIEIGIAPNKNDNEYSPYYLKRHMLKFDEYNNCQYNLSLYFKGKVGTTIFGTDYGLSFFSNIATNGIKNHSQKNIITYFEPSLIIDAKNSFYDSYYILQLGLKNISDESLNLYNSYFNSKYKFTLDMIKSNELNSLLLISNLLIITNVYSYEQNGYTNILVSSFMDLNIGLEYNRILQNQIYINAKCLIGWCFPMKDPNISREIKELGGLKIHVPNSKVAQNLNIELTIGKIL